MNNESVIQTIIDLDNQRTQALLDGDIDKVESFIGSSLHYVHSSAIDEDRTLYLKRLREGFYRYLALESSEHDFRQFGDSVLVNGVIRVHVMVDGTEKDFTARYTQIWAMENDDWKMVGWQTTLFPPV